MDNYTEFKNQDSTSKRSPFEDLSKEELVSKCKGLLVIAQKAKQAKSEFQNDVSNYKTQLEAFKAENKSKEESIKTLQELVDSLTEQKLNFITEIDETRSKLKVLTNQCNVYEQKINEQKSMNVSQMLSDLDSEIISLKRQNSRLSEENDQLISQLTELEARIEEFNCIGLQQREQLKVLEEKVQQDMGYETKIEELNLKIKELEANLESTTTLERKAETENYDLKIQEIMELYESEKSKKEKANIKLRSYKDKILKCANCINQLKNSRYILMKTVKEYSENIPKWQNEIILASKILENQMKELNNENSMLRAKIELQEKELSQLRLTEINVSISSDEKNKLKEEIKELNSQLLELKQQLLQSNESNISLTKDITNLKSKFVEKELFDHQMHENNILKMKNIQLQTDLNDVSKECNNHEVTIVALKDEKSRLNNTLMELKGSVEAQEKTILLIKALESEKAILVKEKQTAKDSIIELENKNKTLSDSVNNMKQEIQDLKNGIDYLQKENKKITENYNLKKDDIFKEIKNETKTTKQQYDQLKKEYDNLQDLNGLLQEEVETLKLSLEQPQDDTENLSDINVSLQADIVKLETKLSAYKQENASLLVEVKETRSKIKEFDNLASECEDLKSKLVSYKTENAELLNEMKEINQVLKERGEAISKLQKAIAEMERLIETIEKDRDTIKEERNNLLIKVDNLESEIKNAEQNTSKHNEMIEKIIAEKDATLKLLEEKDALIVALKEDIEKFKQPSSSTAELPYEDMSTSTISRAEEHMRMRELDETFEDKYTKLRIFALKLKKKLNETNAQLQSTEQERNMLKKMLAENSFDNNQKQSNDKVFDDTDCTESDLNKTNLFNLEAKIKKLSLDLEESEKKINTLPELEADLLKKNQELSAEIEAHKVTKEQLEKALKDVKKKNVLSLEMEDYERSMKELTTKMEENKKKIIQMESTIDTQESTITAMKTQIKLLEEQIKTEETQNRLLKEELQQAIEDDKEKINLINAKKDIITKLMQDLENEKRKNEEANLEMTSALSEKEKIIMSFSEERADLNSRMKKVEFKCVDLNEKLRITNIELADLKTEYTSYKVRAQAVLRQNQTIDHSQEEQLKEEAAALKAQVEILTQKLATTQDQCSELSAEVESSRKKQTEASSEAARAHQRTARLQADLTRISQQLDTERSQHKLQLSTLTQCYKTQIGELEERLQKETEGLKKQIALLQDNMRASKTNEDSSRDKYLLPVLPREDSDTELDINVSLIPREEGEGSEAAPSPPISKSLLLSGGRRSPVPLERLLEEGVPDNDTLDTSSLTLTSEQEIADLKRKVQSQQQRVKHVTVLLAESERECARLSQLSELLKGELRRVRASALNAHNTEYMKNVTLKFLTLPPGDERSRLVPVLQKILTLSSDETHKIQAIAKGQDPNPGKSWGSYLPWPGGK